MQNHLTRIQKLLAALTVFLYLPGILLASEILDPKAKTNNPLLRELSAGLHKYRIDVMLDCKSEINSKGNPILAPLADYILRLDSTLTQKNAGDVRWGKEFDNANNGIVMGVKGTQAIEAKDFRARWDAVPADQRIFISFAREDATIAKTIKKELMSKGYQVFIYYNGEKDIIRSADDIAYFMQTASNCLVIDTEVARRKFGVLSEALAHAKYIYNRRPDIVRVYGTNSCSRTKGVIREFKKTNAKVVFVDINSDINAARYVQNNVKYLQDGDLLPLVVINGKPVKFTTLNIHIALSDCDRPLKYPPY